MTPIESTAVVTAITIALFAWNRLPVIIVAIGAALALWATGAVTLEQATAGFGDRAVLFIASLFIVSHVALAGASDAVAVEVARAAGAKCERCWTWSEKVGKLSVHAGVCERCADVLARSA